MAINATARHAVVEHGKYIYIYNHVRTKQVVYSLTQSIRSNRALKQLTFVGKKSVPAEIRRDLWQPLATITFPSERQGLSAFQKLREFRKLHEYAWEPEPGEAPPPKRERIKMLMDQKANSIADLAAVLKIQEKDGAFLEDVNQKRMGRAREYLEKEEARIDKLAQQADNGMIDLFKGKVERLETRYENEQSPEKKKALRDQLRAYRRKMIQMRTAQKEISARTEDIDDTRERNTELRTKESTPENNETSPAKQLTLEAMAERARKRYPGPLPKHGWLRSTMKPLYPRYSLDGVLIKWADLTDAEYAESWPQGVLHDVMGYAPAGIDAPSPSARPRDFNGELYGADSVASNAEQQVSEDIQTPNEQKDGMFGKLRSIFSREGKPQSLDRPPA